MLEIVVPAYNEEARLGPTLEALRTFITTDITLRAHGLSHGSVRVVVVDNASSDNTRAVAEAADSVQLPVHVIDCAVRGKGAATAAGVAQTTADVVAFMDADGATDFSALVTGLGLIRTGAHLAVGSRAILGAEVSARHASARVHGAAAFRTLARTVVPGIADTQCGMKVMRGDIARLLFADLSIRGFTFDVELLAMAQRRLLTIAEFPVRWVDQPGSTFRPAVHGVSSFVDLARVQWRLRRTAFRPGTVEPAVHWPSVEIALPRQEIPLAARIGVPVEA